MPDNTQKEAISIANTLLTKLSSYAFSAGVKYQYYNATQPLKDIGISLPSRMANIKPGIGWASRAVNTLADRLNFDGFSNDTYAVNNTMRRIGAYEAFSKSITDALIAGCSFVAVVQKNGEPRVIPFTATEATGEVDENTGLLKYGVAVTEWMNCDDKTKECWSKVGLTPKNYYLFMPNYTAEFLNGRLTSIAPNATGRPMLHVITHRQSADRPMGKSRISNTVRRIVDEVGRLKIRYEVAAEFYSTPQRYINGLAQGAAGNAKIDSQLGKIWAFTKDGDGEKPEIGQLAQMSINQFSEQKKDLARDFCAETALTLRNLGYETSNPTSAEALSAMSDDLLLEAQECQREIGEQFKRIAISIVMAMNSISAEPVGMQTLRASWKPVFQLDLGSAGDALFKLFSIMPELAGTTTAYRMLGMSMSEAEELAQRKSNTRANNFMQTEEGNE